jgi:nicotinamidase-related amidase
MTVVIVVISTNVAILNSVFDAVNLGYQVVFPVDAIAGVPLGYTELLVRHTLSLAATTVSAQDVLACWPPAEPGTLALHTVSRGSAVGFSSPISARFG